MPTRRDFLGLALLGGVSFVFAQAAVAGPARLTLSDAEWRHLAMHGHRFHADGSYGLAYDPGIAVNVRAAVRDWDFWASWDGIACPALVLHGAQSDLLSAEVADAMSKRGPKAELVSFEGIGHAPALMSTDQTEVVAQWLARQP